jgi:hypothetical protein
MAHRATHMQTRSQTVAEGKAHAEAMKKPPGVSRAAWNLWLENQLLTPVGEHIVPVSEVNEYGDPVNLDSDVWQRQSPRWGHVELELSKLDPDYDEVERLVALAVADDVNREGQADPAPRVELSNRCIRCGRPYGPPHDGFNGPYCHRCHPEKQHHAATSLIEVALFVLGIVTVMIAIINGPMVLVVLGAGMMAVPAILSTPTREGGVGVALVATVALGGLLAASQGTSEDSSQIRNAQVAACKRVNDQRQALNEFYEAAGRPVRLATNDCEKILQGR